MANYELISFDSPSTLAWTAADAWITIVEAAGRQIEPHLVALSGGRIAREFFSASVENAHKRKVSFAPVHFFWADERCVPPEDPESNYAVANQLLFQPLAIAANQIHRIRGEIPPEEAASQAAVELSRLAPTNSEGQSVLDQVFLGMGEDGHVASLFPGMPEALVDSRVVYLAVTATKPPPRRITLAYAAISAAREVWVLASGQGKERALQASLRPDGQTPLAHIL